MKELIAIVDLKDTGTQSAWFSNCNIPYSWNNAKSGHVTRKKPFGIDESSTLSKILNDVNSSFALSLNSCLIQFYPNGHNGVRLHDDLEPEMSRDDPIVVLTVGSTRPIEFYNNYQSPSEKPALTLNPLQGSIYTMLSGSQDYFRHRVPADMSCDGWRASFSFRSVRGPTYHDIGSPKSELNVVPPNVFPPTSIVVSNSIGHLQVSVDDSFNQQTGTSGEESETEDVSQMPDCPSEILNSSVVIDATSIAPLENSSRVSIGINTDTPKQQSNYNSTVLFGSSMTKFLNQEQLSVKNREFVNISSQSGARLLPIPNKGQKQPWLYSEMLENFAAFNEANLRNFDSIVFSVGTNDLRFFRQSDGRPGDLRVLIPSIEHLIKRSRELFGQSVNIVFKSVLPMRCMYTYTAANFQGFNQLLRRICQQNGCYFIDWFKSFLNFSGDDIDKSMYRDCLHLNRKGHDVLHKLFKKLLSDRYIFYSNTYMPRNIYR